MKDTFFKIGSTDYFEILMNQCVQSLKWNTITVLAQPTSFKHFWSTLRTSLWHNQSKFRFDLQII